ncbi:hypothetical protein [Photorhabdus caribbeanensis]|uniref:hypothetical protein n=1 Tax=Photorhabdus caribbeanensis TaxID=1004165 RepID=UPI001BD32EE3|nr:hypothetical protein [Photorhabdus caribbeanensis]MBS9424082.1 hypothetical protein [Photorhabdus caribbeanensis]
MLKLIPESDFDIKLNMTEKNVEHTQAFIEHGVQDFSLPGFVTPYGYRLLTSISGNQYRLVTDVDMPETVYAVKLEFMEHIVPSKKTCTQILVWCTVLPQHDEAVRGLPQEFFRFFLERYSIIVSDSEQTLDGRRFWERMIAWAISINGYHVYVSDGAKGERPLNLITSWDDFYVIWANYCWGHDKDYHYHCLFVISKELLH